MFSRIRNFSVKYLSLVIVLLAIPLTIVLTQHQQTSYGHAATPSLLSLEMAKPKDPLMPKVIPEVSAISYIRDTQLFNPTQIAMHNYRDVPSVDLHTFTPVSQSQGGIDDCTTWAIAYYYKGWLAKKNNYFPGVENGQTNSFSAMFTYYLVNKGRNAGSSPEDVFKSLETNGALARIDETNPPQDDYIIKPPTQQELIKALSYKIRSYKTLYSYDIHKKWFSNQWASNPDNQGAIEKSFLGEHLPVVVVFPLFPGMDQGEQSYSLPVIDSQPYLTSPLPSVYHAAFADRYDATGLYVEFGWGSPVFGQDYEVKLTWNFVNTFAYQAYNMQDLPPSNCAYIPDAGCFASNPSSNSYQKLGLSCYPLTNTSCYQYEGIGNRLTTPTPTSKPAPPCASQHSGGQCTSSGICRGDHGRNYGTSGCSTGKICCVFPKPQRPTPTPTPKPVPTCNASHGVCTASGICRGNGGRIIRASGCTRGNICCTF